jgi:hypothetical protein
VGVAVSGTCKQDERWMLVFGRKACESCDYDGAERTGDGKSVKLRVEQEGGDSQRG